MKPRRWDLAPLLLFSLLISSSLAWISSDLLARSPRNHPFLRDTAVGSKFGPRCATRSSAQDYPSQSHPCGIALLSLLRKHGYASRLITISDSELPLLAEVFLNGQSVIGHIAAFERSPAGNEQEHKVRFDFKFNATEINQVVLDLGQITTIWQAGTDNAAANAASLILRRDDLVDKIPVAKSESALDGLYRSRVGRSRSGTLGLSKKQVSKITTMIEDRQERQHADNVLRKVLKAGSGFSRLVDSSIVCSFLQDGKRQSENASKRLQHRALCAHLLSTDASTGGRFKRFPCISVSSDETTAEGSVSNNIGSMTLINGGWIVVDQSVRAGTEARKFIERAQPASDGSGRQTTATAADERISRRLECLAMGELFFSDNREPQDHQDHDLQLDVRETLSGMDLPLSPKGATEALIRIGRWSGKENFAGIEPWPKNVLEAASWYAEMNRERSSSVGLENDRVDLTMYPCVSVDAKRTSFRDDALGVRPRASTGRKVDAAASKWEILIHIVDLSDIYSPDPLVEDPSDYLPVLRKAAKSRGESRYDLPLGPLHLLPPKALRSLALSSRVGARNRCVTLWVYFDERDGRILDAGIERTLISPPVNLSFAEASMLLDDSAKASSDPETAKARAVLQVAERNLKLWSLSRRQNSAYARKREGRLAARENEGQQTWSSRDDPADDGRSGFRRTGGHRLVDSSLDIYAYVTTRLLQRSKAPVPRTAGADASRGARVGTAPLRRFIDGVAQRQILSVCCGFGGPPMSLPECVEAGKAATDAKNTISNVRATRDDW